jgi:exodeoxyribonuclease VII large subunit
MAYTAPAQKIFTVSQLNSTVRRLLESEFSGIWLTGEISNFVRPASGHWYFSLKDDSSQIRGAMFKGNNRSCGIKPQDGMQVLVRARISLYEPRGDYQIIIEQMEPAGDGLLKQQFEQLKNRLAAQGLFAQAHKKALPPAISRVGVITSHTGAAVKDIISVLKRRAPQLEIIVYPTSVQGHPATQQIAATIELADNRNEVDILIVGRGGGSLEDLWCFNEEIVAKAIYQCNIPIVSAVGHEIDVTISDFVADVRAATPSAAAELISPDSTVLVQNIDQYNQQLLSAFSRRLNDAKNSRLLLEQQLLRLHPQNVLNSHAQKVDELSMRLNNAILSRNNASKANQAQWQNRFKLAQTAINIPHKQSQLTNLSEQLNQFIQQQLVECRNKLDSNAKHLDIVSPLSTLKRGYSITMDQQRQVVKSVEALNCGDIIESRLADGTIKSRVL